MHTHTHNLLDLLARWRKLSIAKVSEIGNSHLVPDHHLSLETSNLLLCGDWSSVHSCCCSFLFANQSSLPGPGSPWVIPCHSENIGIFSLSSNQAELQVTRWNIPKTFILHYLILPIASAISCQILSLWPNTQGHSIPSCCLLKEIHLPYFATQISWEIWVHHNFSPPTALQGLSL